MGTVSACRGLSGLSAAALFGFGGGGVATRMRGGVGGGVVRNVGVPVAIARTLAPVRKKPEASAGSSVPKTNTRTQSGRAAVHSVQVVKRKGRKYSRG